MANKRLAHYSLLLRSSWLKSQATQINEVGDGPKGPLTKFHTISSLLLAQQTQFLIQISVLYSPVQSSWQLQPAAGSLFAFLPVIS